MKRILLVTGVAALALSSAPVAAQATGRPVGSEPVAQRAVQRASVTDIREVLNRRSQQVQFYKGEDKAMFTVPANGRWAGSMWIPWVGNNGEMWKSITISWGGVVRYRVFQDYWNTMDQVRFSTTNSYQNSSVVPGNSTGGGRKTLIVQSDGSLSMQNSG
jgi:hypothetical protein